MEPMSAEETKCVHEYVELQKFRCYLGKSIRSWGNLYVPLAAGLVVFILMKLNDFIEANLGLPFLIVMFVLFVIISAVWISLRHLSDKGVVMLYRRLVELEQRLGWETQTKYYFNNLSRKSKKELIQKLELFCWNEIKDFEKFKKKASEKHEDIYELLTKVHDNVGATASVGKRGHLVQDLVVYTVIVIFVAIFVWGCFNGWWVTSTYPQIPSHINPV